MALFLIALLWMQTPAKPKHLTLRDMDVWICVANDRAGGETCKSAGDVARYIQQGASEQCDP